jgi:hypothetical protein
MKIAKITLLAAAVIILSAGLASASIIVTIESASISVGQSTTIDISISGNPASGTSAATAFNFQIPYATSNFTVNNLVAGQALSGLTGFGDYSVSGNIIGGFFNGSAPVIPNGVIASFDVTGVKAGVYALNFSDMTFFNANSEDFAPGTVTGGTLTVNAVPIPAAVWLLGSGLVGLVGLRRRMRK